MKMVLLSRRENRANMGVGRGLGANAVDGPTGGTTKIQYTHSHSRNSFTKEGKGEKQILSPISYISVYLYLTIWFGMASLKLLLIFRYDLS